MTIVPYGQNKSILKLYFILRIHRRRSEETDGNQKLFFDYILQPAAEYY